MEKAKVYYSDLRTSPTSNKDSTIVFSPKTTLTCVLPLHPIFWIKWNAC